MVLLFGGCLLAVNISAASAAESLELNIPALSGKKKVGTRSFELIDRSRPAGFDQPGKRRLMVQVWYPRKKAGGACRVSEYLPPLTAQKLMGFIGVSKQVEVDTRACAGGPVERRKLPLIMFSHAYTANRGVYASLLTDLASRGFIVAAVDHTYDAFAVEFPGGKLVDGMFGSPLASKQVSEAELASLITMRTRDIRFVTTRLLKENRKKRSWLKGRIDPGRIGAFGHSLGGATATRVATVYRRFRASSDVDGSLFGNWPLTVKSKKPYLLLTAEKGLGGVVNQDKSCVFFNRAKAPKFAWQQQGAMHLSFSDFQTLAPQVAEKDPEWPFKTLYPAIIGDLDPATAVRAQRQALAWFFTEYLRPVKKRGKGKVFEPPKGIVTLGGPKPPAGIVNLTPEQLTCQS